MLLQASGNGLPSKGLSTAPKKPTVLSFDCQAGYVKWEKGWSEAKKEWCCKHEKRACPFDCQAGLVLWEKGWSDEKAQWCCQHEHHGCNTTQTSRPIVAGSLRNETTTFNCQVGTGNLQSEWSKVQKTWCCKNKHVGCAVIRVLSDDEQATPTAKTTESMMTTSQASITEKKKTTQTLSSTTKLSTTDPMILSSTPSDMTTKQMTTTSNHQVPTAGSTSTRDAVMKATTILSAKAAEAAADTTKVTTTTRASPMSIVIRTGESQKSLIEHRASETKPADVVEEQSAPVETEIITTPPVIQTLNNTQNADRTKKIVGGVVGGSLGVLAVGLLGGLLGAVTSTKTMLTTTLIPATKLIPETTTLTTITKTTTSIVAASKGIPITNKIAHQHTTMSWMPKDFSSFTMMPGLWWWIALLVLLPCCIVSAVIAWNCICKRTNNAKKANKKSTYQNFPSSPMSPSSSCEAPILGTESRPPALSPVELAPFPGSRQSARTIALSPQGSPTADDDKLEANSVLPAGNRPLAMEGCDLFHHTPQQTPQPTPRLPFGIPISEVQAHTQAQLQQAHAQHAIAIAQAQIQAQAHANAQAQALMQRQGVARQLTCSMPVEPVGMAYHGPYW